MTYREVVVVPVSYRPRIIVLVSQRVPYHRTVYPTHPSTFTAVRSAGSTGSVVIRAPLSAVCSYVGRTKKAITTTGIVKRTADRADVRLCLGIDVFGYRRVC